MPPLSPAPETDRVATLRSDHDEAFSSVVSGTLVPLRRHRAWHVLGLCTGLVLLPHGFGALARLLGLRRRATLKVEPDGLVVETRVELLGSTVTHTDLRLRHEAVTGAAVSRAQPAGLLLVGAIVGLAVAVLGVKFLANGILVKAASLSLAGAGIVCLGIGVDLAAFALGRFLAGRRGVSVSVIAHGDPLVTISGVEPARATRFVRALLGARAPAADAVPVPNPGATRLMLGRRQPGSRRSHHRLLLALAWLAVAPLALAPAAAPAQPSSTPTKAGTSAKAGKRGKAEKAPCRRDRDEIVPLKYPDGGQVWIPREVGCGGKAEVIILLHGNQGNREAAPSLGGGRHLERLARTLITSGAVRPVILAEPVHYSTCGSGGDLFGGRFSPVEYRKRLFRLLGARKIRPASLAVIGHSGAGCCPKSGVFKAAEQLGRLKLLATSDTCYHSQAYSQRLQEVLKPGTIYVNVARGEPAYDRYKTFETEMLGKKPHPFRLCRKELYRRCIKNPVKPWFSYTTLRTDAGYHDGVAYLALRNSLLRWYGPKKKPKVMPAEDHPPGPPPDFVGPPAPSD